MGERTPLAELEVLACAAFRRAGVPEAHAAIVAHALVEAEARGIESHGVRMLPGYVSRLLACRQGLIGIATTNSVAAVAPPGGRVGRVGNTATAYAIPTDEEPPLALDISMSTAARSRFALHAERGDPLPEGWAIDAEGRPTTDAKAGLGGYLLPLGSPTAGHKGFGLAMLMDTLAGALSGANFGIQLQRMTDDDPRAIGLGHFMLAVDPSWFGHPAQFRKKIDRMIRDLRATPTQPGVERIYAPGERSHARWLDAQRHGMELSDTLVARIKALAGDAAQ